MAECEGREGAQAAEVMLPSEIVETEPVSRVWHMALQGT